MALGLIRGLDRHVEEARELVSAFAVRHALIDLKSRMPQWYA
jgi:hypothetical protein